MGCGASTEERDKKKEEQYSPARKNSAAQEDSNNTAEHSGAAAKRDTDLSNNNGSNNNTNGSSEQGDTLSDQVSEHDMSDAEKEQVRRIRSSRKKQFTLSSNPDKLDHYQVATFQISEADTYFTKEVEVVERKPFDRRRSSLKPPSMPTSPNNGQRSPNLSQNLSHDLRSNDSLADDTGSEPPTMANGDAASPSSITSPTNSSSPRPLKKKVTWNKLK